MELLLSAEGMDGMNSFSDFEPGVESELIDLDTVPFTRLRELDSEPLRRSLCQVVERTRHVAASYRSADNSGAGERID
ncbi:hypothetical protein [Actinophytocola sediminis]